MAFSKRKKLVAGLSSAGLVVALTAAIGPSAFAASQNSPLDVNITTEIPTVIAGAPGASTSDVDNYGVALAGTWQYPGTGKADVTAAEDFFVDSAEILAGRVTVQGAGIADAWTAADVAGANPYDFWFRFRDYDLGQGGQYKGADFSAKDSNTLEMVSAFDVSGFGLEEGQAFLKGADIQLLSNLDWAGEVTVTIEFLRAPAGTTDPNGDNVEVVGSATFSTSIVPAIGVSEHPQDVTVTTGEDATFTALPLTNAAQEPVNAIALDDIVTTWEVSTDGGSTWDELGDDSTTLSLDGVTEDGSGFLYRAVFTAGDGNFSAVTDAAKLTVNSADVEDGNGEDGADETDDGTDETGDGETNDDDTGDGEKKTSGEKSPSKDSTEESAKPVAKSPSFTG